MGLPQRHRWDGVPWGPPWRTVWCLFCRGPERPCWGDKEDPVKEADPPQPGSKGTRHTRGPGKRLGIGDMRDEKKGTWRNHLNIEQGNFQLIVEPEQDNSSHQMLQLDAAALNSTTLMKSPWARRPRAGSLCAQCLRPWPRIYQGSSTRHSAAQEMLCLRDKWLLLAEPQLSHL